MAGFQSFSEDDSTNSSGFTGFAPNTTMGGRSTSQGNPYKYKEDYGWRMRDDQYEELEDNRSVFENSLSNYRKMATGKINTAQSEYEKANELYKSNITKSKSQLDAAKTELGKLPSVDEMFNTWYKNEPKVLVKNVGMGAVEKPGTGGAGEGGLFDNAGNMEYKEIVFSSKYVPYSTVKSLYDNKDAAKLRGTWSKDKKTYTMSQPTRHVVVDKLIDQLSDKNQLRKSFIANDEVLKAYGTTAKKYATAQNQLATANKQISTYERKQGEALSLSKQRINAAKVARDTAIATEEAKRQAQLDVAKAGYEKMRSNRQKAFAGLQNLLWKSGGENE